jgi:uncharacterized protein YxeA
MKKIVVKVLALVAAPMAVVLLAGIYKFKFTNDDIYVKNTAGDWVQYDKRNESN